MERDAAAITVLEFNDTACKPKQGLRETNGEKNEGEKWGGGKKRSSQLAYGPVLMTRIIWLVLTVEVCIWFCGCLHKYTRGEWDGECVYVPLD